ncbi:MAG: molybdopterin-dependent oxidoreductase [Desulfobacterales bacterium]|jgi:anaerobic selenocysteine-containing dehydrogenase|nr:molybdopterin-dependent oxidoreductase [Desulfobacterales bacterium]
MKIDRRSFLAFVIGGAAGSTLSPLPWKLTDDISIWTQNWPWTPVPPRGERTFVTSTCTLCPGGCGISVCKVDDRVIKVEGLKGHPVNDGGICPLGLSAAQLLYSSTRVPGPLKKVAGGWQEVSWSSALGDIAFQLSELRAKAMPESVAWISESDRGTTAELCKRLLTVFGSPNYIRTPSLQDTLETALYLTQGQRAMAGFDLEQADFVLSFGAGLIEGWGSPGHMLRARSAMRAHGGRITHIDPRLSKTAAKADRWIPIQPGTEGALALGLAHVIIREGLFRKEFVDGRTAGFEAFKQLAGEGFAPEAVAKLTGIDAKTIVGLAQSFAGAKKPLAVCGRGSGRVPGGLQEALAVHYLNALVGSINRPGGVIAVPEPEYINWPEPEMDATASKGMQQPRLDGAGSSEAPLARYLLNRLPKALASASASPVQALFVSGANPVHGLAGTAAVAQAFRKIPLIVSLSPFMDETAAMAHYILPTHTSLERYEDVPSALGFPRPVLGLSKPAIKPLLNTKHAGDVVIELARALRSPVAGAFPWADYEGCLKQTLGGSWAALTKAGFVVDAKFSPSGFETASKKFEFKNSELAKLPAFAAAAAPGDERSFPLLLVPYDTLRLAVGAVGSPPFLMKTLEETVLQQDDVLVEINPSTAGGLGLVEGAAAMLSTPQGRARVRVHITDGIMPGLVAMPRGLGHTAHDKFLAGKGVNINDLIAPVEDPASGFEAGWGIRAKLAKA